MPLQQINVSPLEWQSEPPDGTNSYKMSQTYTVSAPPYDGSQSSSLSSTSCDICRICHCEGDSEVPLIAPCYCAGSLRYVHQACLQQWIKSSNIRSCELCKFQFIMQTKTKPFSEWEHLEMSGFERRKLLCAIMFHAVALTCVVWSLYVLIDRTAEEIQSGLLEWPFWTKLIVVAIGFTGGVVFMYIQCKAYLQICQRWKAFNRVIYVQNAPEKPSLPSPLAQLLVVPNPPQVGPSQSVGESYANQPTSSDNQLKPYQDGSQCSSATAEETSIDLKNVRNVHIFFNDENRIRVQKEDMESCTVDLENINNENIESSTGGEGEAHGTSWHIKIGKTKDPIGKGNDITMSSSSHESYGAVENNGDKIVKSNESNVSESSPVLKLQIKKAEIVIKFGQKQNNNDTQSNPSEEKDEKTNDALNIKINNEDKDVNEPLSVDLKSIEAEHKDAAPLISQDDVSDEYNSPTSKLLTQGSANREEVTHFWSTEQTSAGSETPLLVRKDKELNINKVD